jgi:hypothetical protein
MCTWGSEESEENARGAFWKKPLWTPQKLLTRNKFDNLMAHFMTISIMLVGERLAPPEICQKYR